MADAAYGGFTILSSPFFVEGVLPFILIFSLVFAVLQKSKLLGDGAKQLDALVSFSVALLTIAFANAVNVIVQLVPVLAVGLVVILIFMVMWGSVTGPHDGTKIHKGVKWAFGILVFIVVAGATLYYTGAIDSFTDFFDASDSSVWTNLFFIALIVGAIAVVVSSGKSGGSDADSKDKH